MMGISRKSGDATKTKITAPAEGLPGLPPPSASESDSSSGSLSLSSSGSLSVSDSDFSDSITTSSESDVSKPRRRKPSRGREPSLRKPGARALGRSPRDRDGREVKRARYEDEKDVRSHRSRLSPPGRRSSPLRRPVHPPEKDRLPHKRPRSHSRSSSPDNRKQPLVKPERVREGGKSRELRLEQRPSMEGTAAKTAKSSGTDRMKNQLGESSSCVVNGKVAIMVPPRRVEEKQAVNDGVPKPTLEKGEGNEAIKKRDGEGGTEKDARRDRGINEKKETGEALGSDKAEEEKRDEAEGVGAGPLEVGEGLERPLASGENEPAKEGDEAAVAEGQLEGTGGVLSRNDGEGGAANAKEGGVLETVDPGREAANATVEQKKRKGSRWDRKESEKEGEKASLVVEELGNDGYGGEVKSGENLGKCEKDISEERVIVSGSVMKEDEKMTKMEEGTDHPKSRVIGKGDDRSERKGADRHQDDRKREERFDDEGRRDERFETRRGSRFEVEGTRGGRFEEPGRRRDRFHDERPREHRIDDRRQNDRYDREHERRFDERRREEPRRDDRGYDGRAYSDRGYEGRTADRGRPPVREERSGYDGRRRYDERGWERGREYPAKPAPFERPETMQADREERARGFGRSLSGQRGGFNQPTEKWGHDKFAEVDQGKGQGEVVEEDPYAKIEALLAM